MSIDQCPIQLAVQAVSLFPQVGADHVMQQHPIGVAAVITDQR